MNMGKRYLAALIVLLTAVTIGAGASVGSAAPKPANGTTLAGYKTLDICEVSPASETAAAVWRYSGEISVWNEGVLDTIGLTITDVLEYKTGNKWLTGFNIPIDTAGSEIPAGTTLQTATTFPYSIDGPALAGTIRNTASVKILNHSGSLGKAFGPSPKVTYSGQTPPAPCGQDQGCTLTRGYWGDKPDVIWPAPYDRSAAFFLSVTSWQGVLDTPAEGNAYYILGAQYIAAVLNVANGAVAPDGVADTIALAAAWFEVNAPSVTGTPGSGGIQKTWAGILDDFNNGRYEGGPPHCD